MHEQQARNLPWLDRLAMWIPGYGGYLKRSERRSADRMLRDAIANRLTQLKSHLEGAVRDCLDREALSEINALDRIGRHVEKIQARIRSAGSGTDDFYKAGDLTPSKADPLHAADLALFERADALATEFDRPDEAHDRLARIEAGLRDLESTLDQRAMLLQGIR